MRGNTEELIAALIAAAAVALPAQPTDLAERVLEKTRVLGPKAVLVDRDPDAFLSRFNFVSVEGQADGQLVDANGPGFAKAFRIRTERKPQEWQTHLQGSFQVPVRAGDLLYLTAMVRLVRTVDARPEGVGRLYASEERVGNMNDSSPLYGGDFAIRQEWTRLHFPLRIARDHGLGDELKLMFTFGHTAQAVEFGGLCLVQFPSSVQKEQLPHEELRLDYEGRDPAAAWRKEALARIEQVRTAPLTVRVRDADGRPVPNATVEAVMLRSAFRFGGVVPTGMIPGQKVKPWNADFQRTAGASEEVKARVCQEFLRLFNAATSSVTWTLWYGGDERISRSDIMAGLRWYKANGIDVRNTQAVYPSPEFTPSWAQKLMNPDDKEEFGEAIREYLRINGERFSPYVSSIQIANELEGRPQYTNVLGRESVLDWFRWAKDAGQGMEVMVNGPYELGRGVIRIPEGSDQWPTGEGLQWYAEFIAYLQHHRAPFDSIGFQHHTSIGAPGPVAALQSLDQFAAFGVPLEITEFEITLQDGKDAEQRAYQADLFRDMLIAFYSHPSVTGVLLQDFWQPGAWQYEGASALLNDDFSVNPHGREYERLVLGEWRTRDGAQTDPEGKGQVRGHLGDYLVTVRLGTRTVERQVELGSGGATLEVVLE